MDQKKHLKEVLGTSKEDLIQVLQKSNASILFYLMRVDDGRYTPQIVDKKRFCKKLRKLVQDKNRFKVTKDKDKNIINIRQIFFEDENDENEVDAWRPTLNHLLQDDDMNDGGLKVIQLYWGRRPMRHGRAICFSREEMGDRLSKCDLPIDLPKNTNKPKKNKRHNFLSDT